MIATVKENYAVLTELEDPDELNVILQRIGQRLDEHDDTLEVLDATVVTLVTLTPGWQHIENKTAINQATMDLVFPLGFKEFWVTYYNVKPEINDRGWNSKLSNDGGATFLDGTDYRSAAVGVDSVEAIDNGLGTLEQEGIQSTSRWRLVEQDQGNRAVGNDTDEGVAGSIFIKDPLNALTRTRFHGQSQYTSAANTEWVWTHGGAHHAIEAHNAIRFLFQSGDIVSGEFTLFGLKIAA